MAKKPPQYCKDIILKINFKKILSNKKKVESRTEKTMQLAALSGKASSEDL